MSIDPHDFRQALGRFTTGVTVVTIHDGEAVHGITVSAFLSLSLVPPLVGVSIDRSATAHGLLGRIDAFAVNVLTEDQVPISDRFAGRPGGVTGDPFETFAGHPTIRGALAQLVCRVVQRVPAGDHTLVVGQIEALSVAEGRPLAYFRGAYRRLA
jgi:flavin reductase (DIM6/NTAB) family NADH-FMN oxidoreductase RutF